VDGPLEALLGALQNHANLRIGLHLGGHILDFLLAQRSERLVQLSELTGRGQVELLGGGFYDPILASLPLPSAEAQLQRTKVYFASQLMLIPHGAWLPEQVFEPAIIPWLVDAGYQYAFIATDPVHAAGIDPLQLTGPILLEQGGASLKGLVASHGEEESIVAGAEPWRQAQESGRQLCVWCGDLLRFGDEAQIATLAAALAGLKSIQLVRPDEVANQAAETLSYPNPGSHRAMATWSLPVAAGRRRERILSATADKGGSAGLTLVAGGRWSAFLGRYAEAGRMHRRILNVSDRLDAAALPRFWRDAMRTSLLQAQGHEAFQHGDQSGVYDPMLRQAVHGRLRDVEDVLEHLEAFAEGDPKRLNRLRARQQTLLPDGTQALVIGGTRGHWTICPTSGGALVGMEIPGTSWDLMHAMGRCPERYDDAGNAEPLWSLRDLLIDANLTLSNTTNLDDYDQGTSFEAQVDDRQENELHLHLTGGKLPLKGGHLAIEKHYLVTQSGSELHLTYRIQNQSSRRWHGQLLPRLFVSLPPSKHNKIRLAETVADWNKPLLGTTAMVQLAAPQSRLQWSVVFPDRVPTRSRPIVADHLHLGAPRATLQGVEVAASLAIELAPNASWSGRIVLRALRTDRRR
jgi:hypothetical protein